MCVNTNPCNKCGCDQCDNLCTCNLPDYSIMGCDNELPFGCIQLKEKSVNGTNIVFTCLDFETNETLYDLVGKLESWKCDYNIYKGKVLRDNSDATPEYLSTMLTAGTGILLSPITVSGIEKVQVTATGAVSTPPDEKVKISATDTTTSYLFDKLLSTQCITFSKVNTGFNEKIQATIDWQCALNYLVALPGFCTSVLNCVASLSNCSEITGVTAIGITSTSLFYTWVSGSNNTTWTVSLYTDAGLTVLVPGSTQANLVVPFATFSELSPSTPYWLKIQAYCNNGGSVASVTFGSTTTSLSVTSGCSSIVVNTPVIVNDVATTSWTSVETTFRVYLDNILITSPAQPQVAASVSLLNLNKGYHTIRVESYPCVGVPKSDIKSFYINYP